jgi:hypothetical protein
VTDLLDQISQERYTDELRNRLFTQAGSNRDALTAGPEREAARDYIASRFQSYGLETTLDAFTVTMGPKQPVQGTFSGVNVVGRLTGTKYPERIYILGAHYDSRKNPGADDDGSGVAGLLEAARVLSGRRFESTILLIAFDFEEISCAGANSYAQRHLQDKIAGMVEMDMIAFNEGGLNRAEIWTANPEENAVSKALGAALGRYAGELTVRTGGGEWGSDHGPFAAAGFDSALLTEAAPYSPFYHRQYDEALDVNGNDVALPDGRPYLDYGYAVKMLRGVMGWVAESAVAVEPGM